MDYMTRICLKMSAKWVRADDVNEFLDRLARGRSWNYVYSQQTNYIGVNSQPQRESCSGRAAPGITHIRDKLIISA